MINTSIIIINYVTINNNFNNDNGSTRADMFAVSPELSDWVFYLCCVYLGVVGVFGIVINTVVIWLLTQHEKVSLLKLSLE